MVSQASTSDRSIGLPENWHAAGVVHVAYFADSKHMKLSMKIFKSQLLAKYWMSSNQMR